MFACLFLGDSIAVDAATMLRSTLQNRCAIVVRKGAGTPTIGKMAPIGSFYTAVVSAGSNDGADANLATRLDLPRSAKLYAGTLG